MIFFGWGRRSKSQQIDGGRALVLSWSYFHLFWLFRVSFGLRYGLATATPEGWAHRDLTAEEAAALDAPGALTLHWWWRWGLLIGIAALLAFITFMVSTTGP